MKLSKRLKIKLPSPLDSTRVEEAQGVKGGAASKTEDEVEDKAEGSGTVVEQELFPRLHLKRCAIG